MCPFHERVLSIVSPKNLVLFTLGMIELGTTIWILILLCCLVKNWVDEDVDSMNWPRHPLLWSLCGILGSCSVAKHSGLLGCYAMFLGKDFPNISKDHNTFTFKVSSSLCWRNTVPSCLLSSAWSWQWTNWDTLQRQELPMQYKTA